MDFSVFNYIAIVVICYAVGYGVKQTNLLDNKFIPAICLILGAILGVVAFVAKATNFPATDIVNALAVGFESGLTAVGINQIGKQLISNKNA